MVVLDGGCYHFTFLVYINLSTNCRDYTYTRKFNVLEEKMKNIYLHGMGINRVYTCLKAINDDVESVNGQLRLKRIKSNLNGGLPVGCNSVEVGRNLQ